MSDTEVEKSLITSCDSNTATSTTYNTNTILKCTYTTKHIVNGKLIGITRCNNYVPFGSLLQSCDKHAKAEIKCNNPKKVENTQSDNAKDKCIAEVECTISNVTTKRKCEFVRMLGSVLCKFHTDISAETFGNVKFRKATKTNKQHFRSKNVVKSKSNMPYLNAALNGVPEVDCPRNFKRARFAPNSPRENSTSSLTASGAQIIVPISSETTTSDTQSWADIVEEEEYQD